MKITIESLILTGFIIALFIIGITYAYNTFFINEDNKIITFNVTGIVNATNSSIVSIQFECIKYCGGHIADSYMKDCWKECEGLGKCQ